jgi:hypothetical protein
MRPLILASSFLLLVLTSCSDKKELVLKKCYNAHKYKSFNDADWIKHHEDYKFVVDKSTNKIQRVIIRTDNSVKDFKEIIDKRGLQSTLSVPKISLDDYKLTFIDNDYALGEKEQNISNLTLYNRITVHFKKKEVSFEIAPNKDKVWQKEFVFFRCS